MTDASKAPAFDVPEQLRIRRDKRQRVLESGKDAYPVEVPRTHSLSKVRARWAVWKDDGEAEAMSAENEGITYLATGEEAQDVVSVTGRLIFMRNTGKLCFATLQDGDGTQLQAMLSLAEIGEDALAEWKADVDLGDFIGVTGRVIASLRGELSVMVSSSVEFSHSA